MATNSAESCTVEDLEEILSSSEYESNLPLSALGGVNEVWPRLYVGDGSTAKDLEKLYQLGITHILNVAQGKGIGYVDTDGSYYESAGFTFKGVKATDVEEFELLPFWDDTSKFIHTALSDEASKVLVHCALGFSRAAATTIAYLMMYHKLTAQEATREVRSKRFVGPNEGFLKQLCELNTTLQQKRVYSK
ncbi:dual specificity protein phosphatase 3-like isoform X2 [Glandiceps talaboti]